MTPPPTPPRHVPTAELRAALAELAAAGPRQLAPERWTALLAAVDALVTAVANGPRPGESEEQVGIWRNHERDPALAALADVLVPAPPEEREPRNATMTDAEARIALAAALRR